METFIQECKRFAMHTIEDAKNDPMTYSIIVFGFAIAGLMISSLQEDYTMLVTNWPGTTQA